MMTCLLIFKTNTFNHSVTHLNHTVGVWWGKDKLTPF
jgi:hypothetical protein